MLCFFHCSKVIKIDLLGIAQLMPATVIPIPKDVPVFHRQSHREKAGAIALATLGTSRSPLCLISTFPALGIFHYKIKFI